MNDRIKTEIGMGGYRYGDGHGHWDGRMEMNGCIGIDGLTDLWMDKDELGMEIEMGEWRLIAIESERSVERIDEDLLGWIDGCRGSWS